MRTGRLAKVCSLLDRGAAISAVVFVIETAWSDESLQVHSHRRNSENGRPAKGRRQPATRGRTAVDANCQKRVRMCCQRGHVHDR